MYKVRLYDGEYKLPSGWEEVTFEQLIKLKSANVEFKSNYTKMAVLMGCLMDADSKEILKLGAEEFGELVEACEWIHEFDVKGEFKNEFEFDGVKYKLKSDMNKISMGEMASMEQFIMEGAEENAHKILAVLIREVDEDGNLKEFDEETFEARAEVLKKNLTIAEVHGINAFFLDGGKEYLGNMLGSSKEQPTQKRLTITKMESPSKEKSQENTPGSQ